VPRSGKSSNSRSSKRSRPGRSNTISGIARGATLFLTAVFGVILFVLAKNPMDWDLQNANAPEVLIVTRAAEFTRTPFLPQANTPITSGTARPAPTQGAPVSTEIGAQGGNWWQVLFTKPAAEQDGFDPANPIQRELLRHIDQARASIHLAVYEFNIPSVAEALVTAQRRGVEVRWITDDEYGLYEDADALNAQFALLREAGIPVISDDRSALMHHKFVVFDRHTVWTGSTNLTINDMMRNNNNVIILRSAELAEIYEAQFDHMWEGEFGPSSPSDVEAQALQIQGSRVQALFSPEDDAMRYLIPLVQGAKRSIRFMAFSFTQDDLTEAMLARARAGVEVRGIFETRGSQTTYSALPAMVCAGLPVRQDGNPRLLHHKVIIIDEQIVFTGSLNLSANANNPNNENTLVIDNPAITAPYQQEFDELWAEGKTPSPADITCP